MNDIGSITPRREAPPPANGLTDKGQAGRRFAEAIGKGEARAADDTGSERDRGPQGDVLDGSEQPARRLGAEPYHGVQGLDARPDSMSEARDQSDSKQTTIPVSAKDADATAPVLADRQAQASMTDTRADKTASDAAVAEGDETATAASADRTDLLIAQDAERAVVRGEATPLASLPLWSLRPDGRSDQARPDRVQPGQPSAAGGGAGASVEPAVAPPKGSKAEATGADTSTLVARKDAPPPDAKTSAAREATDGGARPANAAQPQGQSAQQTQPAASQAVAAQTPTGGETPKQPVSIATVDVARWIDSGEQSQAMRDTVASHVARASLAQAPGQPAPVLRLQLQPVHLGQVNITMRVVGGTVSVQVAPETEAAAQMLASDREAMTTVLRSLGGSFAGAQVEIVGDAAGRTDAETGQWRPSPDDEQRRDGTGNGHRPSGANVDHALADGSSENARSAQAADGRIII